MAQRRRAGVPGRADAQVKLRGFRIEPGEIEAALLRQAGVSQAAVVARRGCSGTKRLVWLCGGGGGGCGGSVAALRAALSCVLPDYMVPSAIVVLERLPLTPNGKLDRRALPAPELTPAAVRRAPRTPQEAMLCALFAEVLGVERVGIDDNFFELGGDSIVSIQLVSRARRAGLSITPRAVFQHQTVAALAAVAGGWRRRRRGSTLRPTCRRCGQRGLAGDADHALAAGARRADRSLQPGDAAAGAGGSARGGSGGGAAGGARSSRCVAAAADGGLRSGCRVAACEVAPAARWRRGSACAGSMSARSMARGCASALPTEAQAAAGTAVACGRGDAAGGVVRCRGGALRAAAADDPSSWRWTGCRGASWCRTLRRPGRRCGGAARLRCRRGGTSFRALGAAACGACAGCRRGGRAFVLARDAGAARAVAG